MTTLLEQALTPGAGLAAAFGFFLGSLVRTAHSLGRLPYDPHHR